MPSAQYDGTQLSIARIKLLGVAVKRVDNHGNPFDTGWRVGPFEYLLWIGDWVTVHPTGGIEILPDHEYQRRYVMEQPAAVPVAA